MRVLSLLQDAEQRAHVLAALQLNNFPFELAEAGHPDELRQAPAGGFDLALLAAELPEVEKLIGRLRDLEPGSAIVVLGEIRALQTNWSCGLAEVGANFVLDARHSPYKTALVLSRIRRMRAISREATATPPGLS